VKTLKSIAMWAALGWVTGGVILWSLDSFGPGSAPGWRYRVESLSGMVIAWPYALYARSVLREPVTIVDFMVFKPEIVTDLGVVRPPPPELVNPKKPKAVAPKFKLDEEPQ